MFRKFFSLLFFRSDCLFRIADSFVSEPLVVGDPGNTTTLGHLLYLYGMTENRTVAEVMDTRGVLCYEYDS